MWCCTGDEGLLALRSRPAGGGFKPPSAALAEDCRGERDGKGAPEVSGGDQEDVALNAPVTGFAGDASLLEKVASEPGGLLKTQFEEIETDSCAEGIKKRV